jgi:hypothetical protein
MSSSSEAGGEKEYGLGLAVVGVVVDDGRKVRVALGMVGGVVCDM